MKLFNYPLLLIIFIASCTSGVKQTDEQELTEAKVEAELAVCISNGVPVRENPQKSSKYISSLNLGETLQYLGESAIDSNDNNREYYHVELSDGTIAWARSYGILIGSNSASIVEETPIYKRPDLVTKTAKSFAPMEFIAVVSEKEEWVEVVGAGNTKKGWIMKKNITTQKEDVATATLAYKDLLKDGVIVIENIPTFLEELPYSDTQYSGYLQALLDAQVEEAVLDGIEEYENAENEIYD